MHVHGVRTSRLTLIARAVVSLTEHHGEVAHGRTPFLRHRVCLRRERESMLAVRVGKTFGKVGNGIVERQAAHRQLRLLRLLLLVLRSSLLGTPLVLLLLIHPVHRLHLSRPSLHHGVDAALARGKVAGDVGYKVQRVHLAMHVHSHPSRQHTYHGADGGQHGQRQSRTHSIDGVLHALRHTWQRLVIEEVVLSQRLVYAVRLALLRTAARHALLTYGDEHVLQPLRHLRALLAQRIVNTGQLLRLSEAVIARNNPIEQPTVEPADMTKIHGQLKRKRIAVALHRLLRVIIHRPPLADNVSIRNAQITVRSPRRRSLRRISRSRNPLIPSSIRRIRKIRNLFILSSLSRIRNLFIPSCLPIVKQLLVHEQQPVRRRRKEHTRDVLRPLVILHAQQLRSPSEVLLLRHSLSATKDHVITLVGRPLQHQQPQLLLPAHHQFRHAPHPLLIIRRRGVEVDVHPHRSAHTLRPLQPSVGIRQTRIVHLHHPALLRPTVTLRVAQKPILHLVLHRAHKLSPVLIIYNVYAHKKLLIQNFVMSVTKMS